MKIKATFCFMALALLLVSLPLVSACQAPAPAAKPSVYKFYAIFDLSGPYATIMAAARDAHNDAAEYVNQQGGIKGVPVEFVIRDNGNKIDMTMTHYESIKVEKPKPTMLFLSNTPDGEALHDRVCEDQIVTSCTPSQKSMYPACYSFGWWPSYDEQFGLFVDWLTKNWKESRAPKVAFLTWDTAYGRAPLSDPAYAYAKKKGVDIVATEIFKITDLDCSTQLLRIKEKNPDWIYTNTLTFGPVTILKSAQALGYTIKLAGGNGIGEDAVMMGGGPLFEGVVVINNSRTWDETNHPGIKLLNEWFTKKNRDPKEHAQQYRNSWFVSLLGVEVVKRAVDKVGWDGLNGAALKEQMTKLKDFKPLDGLAVFSYSAQRVTRDVSFVSEIRGGKILPVTDWMTAPDFGPGAAK